MGETIRAAVIGAGMIGQSLCALLTGNEIPTLLYVRDRPLERRRPYERILEELEESGCLTAEERTRCGSYLKVVTDYRELEEVQIVLECGPEKLEVKQAIYENLYENCPKLKAVASATSAIPSQELAKDCRIRDRLLVAHPFYPPHLIPCVEVVPSSFTASEAVEFTVDFFRGLQRQVTVLKKDAPGFVANRLQYAMLREAIHIVEEGIASPEEVDRILKSSFAARYTAVGLFEHFDNCGLDLTRDICDFLYPFLSGETSAPDLLKERCEKGFYGVKSGQGIYPWTKEQKENLERRVREPYYKDFLWNIPQEPYREEEADK